MGLFDVFKKKKFDELIEKALEEELSKSRNEDDIYNEMVNCYVMLISMLNINSFNSFQFPDYEDCRRIVVDGIEYDFDNKFCHNDSDAMEALCAIDCLIADLKETSLELILKKVEKTMVYSN